MSAVYDDQKSTRSVMSMWITLTLSTDMVVMRSNGATRSGSLCRVRVNPRETPFFAQPHTSRSRTSTAMLAIFLLRHGVRGNGRM